LLCTSDNKGKQRKLIFGVDKSVVLTLTCLGAGNAAEAVEVLSLGYILLGLKKKYQSLISSGVYAGMLVGGLVSGYVSDLIRNRSEAFLRALYLATGGALCASLSPGPIALFIFRALAGIGVGAATPPLFALAAEVSPIERRGGCITYVASFWMIGSIFAAGLAKIILRSANSLDVSWNYTLDERWRIYALICVLPALFSALAARRFLLSTVEPLSRIEYDLCEDRQGEENIFEANSIQRANPTIRPRLRHRKRLLILSITFWGLNFGYYGLSTWISVVLDKVGVKDVYGVALMYAAANIPGNIAAFALVDSIGRKPLLVGSMALATLAALSLAYAIYYVPGLTLTIITAMIFNAAATSGWASLDSISAESFPAEDRATALGILTAVGRIASVIAQFVNGALQSNPPLLLSVTAAFMFCGCCATLFGLRESKLTQLE